MQKKKIETLNDPIVTKRETESTELTNECLDAKGCENGPLVEMIAEPKILTKFALDFQAPQRVLKTPDPWERFKVVDRAIAPLAPEILQDIEGIEDYLDRTEASMPIIAQTPEGCFILDGKDMIESARAAGETSIFCEIERIAEHNLTDLVARKAGIRSQTRGGRARYAELVRNAAKLKAKLLQESNLVSFRHGGRRIGESFVGDSENDVVTVMVERLSKSRNTVNNYISHSKNVSDDVMAQLVCLNKEKVFFEKFGKIKSKIIEKLQEERKTQDEITAVVSAAILRCATDGFPETVKPRQAQVVPSAPQQTEYVPEAEAAQGEYATDDDVPDEYATDEDTFDELIPVASESAENPDPVTAVKNSSLQVSSRLAQRIETAKDADALYIVLVEEIRALNSIASKIVEMANPDLKTVQQAA